MTPGGEPTTPPPAPAPPDLESLLAAVSAEEAKAAALSAKPAFLSENEGPQPYDFSNPMLLSPRELRKLRLHQDEFINSLASRLSLHLRMEFTLKLAALQTIAYTKLVESWFNPSHLTLFKLEPLRGVSVLEIQPQLGLSIVERLMGGPGKAPEFSADSVIPDISEIEKALLEQTVMLILEEWCGHWKKVKALKPVILGCENNGRFVQIAPPETIMLVLSLDVMLGESYGKIKLSFPFAALEPLIQHLNRGVDPSPAPAPKPTAAAPLAWNGCFDEICIPATAEWESVEMTAREVLSLKVGDVVQISPESAQEITVRLGDLPKFLGRPGSISGRWAVELTQALKRG